MRVDTLKTLSVGVSGVTVTWIEWIPWGIRLAVAIVSLMYMWFKALNERKKFYREWDK